MSDVKTERSALTTPKVTVLMCVYNGQRYLREAIESILNQTYKDFEFLIVNDGSTDDSRDIVLSYDDPRIHLLDNPTNIGLTKSLNRGLAMARGSLIARFDANDISYPSRLSKQVDFMDLNPGIAVVGAQVRNIDVNGRRLYGMCFRKPVSRLAIKWYLMFGSPINHPTVMYRRHLVWDELHGYDESFGVGQDAELFSRLAIKHSLANLPEVLVDLRLDPSSISGNRSSPVRAGHVEHMERLMHRDMVRYLQDPNMPSEWVRLWIQINATDSFVGVGPALGFLTVIDQIHARFLEINPRAVSNPEIRRHVAEMQYCIARYLVMHNKIVALKAYARACRTDMEFAGRMAPVFFALFVLGDRIRRAYRRLRYQPIGVKRGT